MAIELKNLIDEACRYAPARGLSGASRYSGLNRGKERQRDSE